MILLTKYLGIAALFGLGLLALNAWREFNLRDIYWADLDTGIEILKTKALPPTSVTPRPTRPSRAA